MKEYLGAKSAKRAREEQFGHVFPDCDLGAMPPFGNLYSCRSTWTARWPTPSIVFQAGTQTATINIATSDYLRITAPKISHFALEAETA